MTIFKSKRTALLITIVFALGAVTIACAPEEEVEPEPDELDVRRGGTVVVAWSEEPPTLDAHASAELATAETLNYLGDSVIERDPDDGRLQPHLATGWELSEDGKMLTLSLREDVTFHSGEPFNAHTLKASWDRISEPAHEVAAGRMGPVDNIVVVDDYTLRMEMEDTFAPLLNWVSWRAWAQPVDPGFLEEYGDDYGRNPGSTGPYIFDEWTTGESIRLVRNEDYEWAPEYYDNQGPAYPDALELRFIMEDSTRLAGLETGEIHITRVPAREVERFEDTPEFEIFSYPRAGVCMYVIFNTQKDPIDDLRVRQALSYAIDKSAVITVAQDGRAEKAYGPLPPTNWGYWDGVQDIAYDYNPEKAAELLDEAGWTMEEGESVRTRDGEPLEITMYLAPFDHWQLTSEMVQSLWAEIGVDLDIRSHEFGTHMDYLAEGEHHTGLMGYSTADDPDWLFRYYHSSQAGVGINHPHLVNETLDALVEGQRENVERDKRYEFASDAQQFIMENAVIAPIYIRTEYVAVNEKIQGFDIDYRGNWLTHDMWIDTE